MSQRKPVKIHHPEHRLLTRLHTSLVGLLLGLSLYPAAQATAADELKEVAVLKRSAGSVGRITLPGDRILINSLAFSADSSRLVGTGQGIDAKGVYSQAIVWDVAKQKQISLCQEPATTLNGDLTSPGFSSAWLTADGRTVITQLTRGFHLWNGANGKQLQLISNPGQVVTARAVTADGKYLAIASNERNDFVRPPGAFRIGDIQVWDVKARKAKWKLAGEKDKPPADTRKGFVAQLAFSPDGAQLAALGTDGLRIFALQSGKDSPQLKAASDLADLKTPDRIASPLSRGQVLWCADGILLRGGANGFLARDGVRGRGELREASTGEAKDRSALQSGGPGLVEAYLTGDTEGGLKGTPDIVLWDIGRAASVATLKLPKAQFDFSENETIRNSQRLHLPVALSPNHKWVAVADTYGVVHVYEVPHIDAP